ncbi:MAG: DegQ family serine endoprotease [Deltaproteobacteria bacterium]|nr:DegQ family serine endoprotease [Deltaproteobacteria bacterium]
MNGRKVKCGPPRSRIFGSILVFCVVAILGVALSAAAEAPSSFAPLVEKVGPSVVNISAVKVVEGMQGRTLPRSPFGENDPFEEFFRRFFEDQPPRKFKQRSLGSGFIIDREGFILTNNHVVANTEEIKVTLSNEAEYPAEIVGRDSKTDLALIRIEPDESLNPLPLGDSDTLKVGDWVVAIGSPFGLGNTVTAGIISAKYRRLGQGAYDDFIQTDASINPGNSGGPLLDTSGKVVGINTAIFSRSGGSIGIGFAVPVNMARDLIPQLKEGKVIRGWLGVMIQEVTPELAEKLDLGTEQGALVADVTEGGPADEAGLRRGDVITAFNEEKVEKMNDLPLMVASTPPGTEAVVALVRGGKEMKVEVEIGTLEEETGGAAAPAPGPAMTDLGRLGMEVGRITPELARRHGLSVERGVAVTRIQPDSPAAEAGLRPGDVILEMEREPIEDPADLKGRFDDLDPGDTALLLVDRKGNTLFLTLRIPGRG